MAGCLSNRILQSLCKLIQVFKLLLYGIEGCPIRTNRFHQKIYVSYRETGSLSVKMDTYFRKWWWLNTPEVNEWTRCIPPLLPNGFYRSDRFSDDERKSCLDFMEDPKIVFHQSPMHHVTSRMKGFHRCPFESDGHELNPVFSIRIIDLPMVRRLRTRYISHIPTLSALSAVSLKGTKNKVYFKSSALEMSCIASWL